MSHRPRGTAVMLLLWLIMLAESSARPFADFGRQDLSILRDSTPPSGRLSHGQQGGQRPVATRRRAQITDTVSFEAATVTSPDFDGVYDLYVGDLNGDGLGDIAFVDENTLVQWLANDGSGLFPTSVRISGVSSETLVGGDLGSGNVDLVVVGGLDALLTNDGTGTFRTTLNISTTPVSVALVDMDGDGRKDILTGAAGGISYLKNGVDGYTTVTVVNATLEQVSAIAAADLDGDGEVDVAIALSDQLYWYHNNGDGTYTQKRVTAVFQSSSIVDHDYASLGLADIDGNGAIDIAVLGTHTGTIEWYANDGTGSFTPYVVASGLQFAWSSAKQQLHLADIDADGDIDMVYAAIGGAGWFRNDGNGTFEDQSLYSLDTSMTSPGAVFASDIDGDGDMDIVVASSNTSYMAVMLNQLGPLQSPAGSPTGAPSSGGTTATGPPQSPNEGGVLEPSSSAATSTTTIAAAVAGSLGACLLCSALAIWLLARKKRKQPNRTGPRLTDAGRSLPPHKDPDDAVAVTESGARASMVIMDAQLVRQSVPQGASPDLATAPNMDLDLAPAMVGPSADEMRLLQTSAVKSAPIARLHQATRKVMTLGSMGKAGTAAASGSGSPASTDPSIYSKLGGQSGDSTAVTASASWAASSGSRIMANSQSMPQEVPDSKQSYSFDWEDKAAAGWTNVMLVGNHLPFWLGSVFNLANDVIVVFSNVADNKSNCAKIVSWTKGVQTVLLQLDQHFKARPSSIAAINMELIEEVQGLLMELLQKAEAYRKSNAFMQFAMSQMCRDLLATTDQAFRGAIARLDIGLDLEIINVTLQVDEKVDTIIQDLADQRAFLANMEVRLADFAKLLESNTGVKPIVQHEHQAVLKRLQIPRETIEFVSQVPFGVGGSSKVYRVKYQGEVRAAKVIDLSQHRHRDIFKIYERFTRELYILSKAQSPHVVQVMGAATSATELVMVAEFVPRGSLRTNLDNGHLSGPENTLRSLMILRDMLTGLVYLTDIGVQHRDLKSLNVLVTEDWRAKITDFGLSKTTDALTTTATKSQFMGGTLAWTAPELLMTYGDLSIFTEKCDVYSFGVIVWEVMTGSRPWYGIKPLEVAARVTGGQRLSTPATCSSFWSKMMSACWEQEAASRPSFSQLLESVQGSWTVLCST